MAYPRHSGSYTTYGEAGVDPTVPQYNPAAPKPAPYKSPQTIGQEIGKGVSNVGDAIRQAPSDLRTIYRDTVRDPGDAVARVAAPFAGGSSIFSGASKIAQAYGNTRKAIDITRQVSPSATTVVRNALIPTYGQLATGTVGAGSAGLALAQADRAQTEGMQRRSGNVTMIDNGQMLPDSALRNPVNARARVIDNGQQLPESAFTPGSAFKTARPDFQFAPADGNVMPGRNYAEGVQRRGSQGAVIKNPHGMKIEDRLAGLLSSMKGSPSLRRAAAEAIIGEQQNEFNARQATLDRNDRAESDQMNAQLRANESYADRRLKADTFNQELGLRRRSEQNGNALDKTRLALDTRRQLFDERLAAQQAQSTGAKAISDRYNKVVDDYMKRYPDATFDEAQGYAADLAHRQGYDSQAIDVGRGVDYQRAAAVDDAAAAASGRGIAGTARRWAQNKLTGLDDGDVRSLNEDPSNYVPEELGFPRRVGRAVGSLITGGAGDFEGQMHSDDVVWRDKTTGKSFAAPRETLGGMTVEGFRRRYNEPSDYLRRMNVTQN